MLNLGLIELRLNNPIVQKGIAIGTLDVVVCSGLIGIKCWNIVGTTDANLSSPTELILVGGEWCWCRLQSLNSDCNELNRKFPGKTDFDLINC